MQTLDANHDQDELNRQFDELYARFGKTLEASHRGEYLAISPDGRTIIGATLLDVLAPFRVTVVAVGGQPILGRGVTDRFTLTLDHGREVRLQR